MSYGEIVQFECQVHTGSIQNFYLYFGNTIVHPILQGKFSNLDPREFSVTVNQCNTNCLQNRTLGLIGQVWILVNSRTLQIIEPFRCRIFHNRTFEDSNLAFIEVVHPECTVSQLQSHDIAFQVTSVFMPPRQFLINSTSVSNSVQVLNFSHPCSTSEIYTPGTVCITF